MAHIWRQMSKAQRFLCCLFSCNLLLAIVVQKLCLLLAITTHTQYSVDAANGMYDNRQQQPVQQTQYYATPYQTGGQKYNNQNEYQKQPYSESKQQRQLQQQGNGNMYGIGDVEAAESPNLYRQQQQQHEMQLHNHNTRLANSPSATLIEHNSHKCRIWVPVDALRKYVGARELSMDQLKQLIQIEVCCPGFGPLRWRGNTVCRHLCENCQNGFCVAPGRCQCFDGFVANDNGDCVFTCPLGCLNGRCYLDGSCECEPGYKLDEMRKFCRPICSAGCEVSAGQNCTEPEVCGCAKGFQLKSKGCERICDPDCGTGGQCEMNNTCKCKQGYVLKDNICQSDCYQTCENGICMGRNRCVCNPGFRYHERSTMCIPQ